MGLFSKSPSPEEETSRRYLAIAPPGPRTNNLASSCALQVSETPVAAAERYGELLTVSELAPATETVRGIMAQDRDLSAWIARKSLILLDSVFQAGMTGGRGDKLDSAFGAAGLVVADEVRVRNGAGSLHSDVATGGAVGLGATALTLLVVVTSDPATRTPDERRFYENLYTGANGDDVETLAYDMTAWVSVVLGRLINTGRVKAGLPFLAPAYRQTPRMTTAGWYPNPPKHGDISSGDAQFQRWWDGTRWTDRVRIRNGRGWETGTVSLHEPPVDSVRHVLSSPGHQGPGPT